LVSYTAMASATNHQLSSNESLPTTFQTSPSTAPSRMASVHPTAASPTSFNLSWDVPDCHGSPCTTLTVIWKDAGNGSRTITAPWPVLPVYQLGNLTQGQRYSITVLASNTVGDGPASNSIQLSTTAANATAPKAPDTPTTSNATGSSVVWHWTATRHDGGAQVLNYVLQYHQASSSQWHTISAGWDALTEKVTGLDAAETYCGQVLTTTAVANSSWSNASCVTLPTAWPPGKAVLDPTATTTNGTAIQASPDTTRQPCALTHACLRCRSLFLYLTLVAPSKSGMKWRVTTGGSLRA
jgi:hypothetical protein